MSKFDKNDVTFLGGISLYLKFNRKSFITLSIQLVKNEESDVTGCHHTIYGKK